MATESGRQGDGKDTPVQEGGATSPFLCSHFGVLC